MELSKVHVGRGGAELCLSWQFKGDQYHVWLTPETHEVKPAMGLSHQRPAIYKRRADSQKVTYLDATITKNAAMVAQALEQAKAGKLFEKCEQELAEQERKRLERAAAEYKITLAKEAGPQMLEVLKAISEFWKEGDDIEPLSPGALILEDREKTIVVAVRAAIREAETGGRVAL